MREQFEIWARDQGLGRYIDPQPGEYENLIGDMMFVAAQWAYRAAMERAAGIVDACLADRRVWLGDGLPAQICHLSQTIRDELSALDADSRRCEASKSGDNGSSGTVVAGSEEAAKNGVVEEKRHRHYFKLCPYPEIDVYRVIELWSITDPCQQHALKKILCMGGRGHKDAMRDAQDIIDTMERWQGMRREEGKALEENPPSEPLKATDGAGLGLEQNPLPIGEGGEAATELGSGVAGK